MKKILMLVALFSSLSSIAFAQNVYTNPGGQDPDTFGHSLIYLGLGNSAWVFFDPACGPEAEIAPPNKCIVAPSDGSPAQFEFTDLGSMVIPANSTVSTLWPMMISNFDIIFRDSTGNGGRARFWGSVLITIESPVLNDPAIVDPATGLPANGKMIGTFPMSYSVDQHINGNDMLHFHQRSDASGIAAFTSSYLGLTQKQTKDLFKGPITLRWGLRGGVRNAVGGFIVTGFRIMGDR